MSTAQGWKEAVKGAQRAANAAGASWQDEAYYATLLYITKYSGGEKFTMEDVRQVMPVSDPPDNRAWGAIALRAYRDGLIKKAGYAKSKIKSNHAGPRSAWRPADI